MFRRLRSWRRAGGAEAVTEERHAPIGAVVREGRLVRLRRHVPGNRAAFQRWYADPEIAHLLRHDQRPLTETQSRGYFDTFILPLSARGLCYAIHEAATDRLIGTTALTDVVGRRPAWRTAMFRIVIGEKGFWGRGFGTEATRLVMAEAFEEQDLDEVRLEVFAHNPRAIAAYERVGFYQTGAHVEWVGRERTELHVVEMALRRADLVVGGAVPEPGNARSGGPIRQEAVRSRRFARLAPGATGGRRHRLRSHALKTTTKRPAARVRRAPITVRPARLGEARAAAGGLRGT